MQKNYIPEIDVLRAVAVLSVMICHLNAAWLPGGFAGVDIFFVISGYVVAKSLLERPVTSFNAFMLGFYARRCLRILPALFLVVGLTGIATILFIPESWLSEAVERTGLYAFFGFSNHALYLFDDGYFAPRSDYNPFTHTWSLGVEEQFYLIAPLLLFALITASGKGRKRMVTMAIVVLAVASFLCSWWLVVTDPKAAYYLLPSRFWELAVGVLLAIAHHRSGASFRGGGVALLLGSLSILIGFAFTDPKLFPLPWAIAPVLGTALLLHGIVASDARTLPVPVAAILRSGALRYIGRISYSLYLFHWPIYVLLRWTSGLESPVTYLVAVAATFICASASYHLLEMPIRRLGAGRPKLRHRILTVGGASMLAGVFAFSGMFSYRNDLALTVTSQKSLWQAVYEPRPSTYDGQTFPEATLFAIGDSHLGAYAPMIRWAADDLGMQARLYPTDGCQLGRIFFRLSQTPTCQDRVAAIMEEVKSLAKPGDIVFFASLRSHRLVDQWLVFDIDKVSQFNESERYHKRLEDAAAQNAPYFSDLAALGLTVLIDLPKPVLPAVPYRCADWFNRSNPICRNGLEISRARLDTLNAPMIRTLYALQEDMPALRFWDPFPHLCPGDTCGAFMDGKPLFYDGDHISQYGNEVLYPHFRRELVGILSGATQATN